MLDVLKIINHEYAEVLSLLSSLVMVIVTIIYVMHTKRQAHYAKESVELVTKQIKISKQPCVAPSVVDSYGSAFDVTDYTRMQLDFAINLKNVGDAPAINIYTTANIELQLSIDTSGTKKSLSAALLPYYVQTLSIGEEKEIHIHFETAEINALLEELKKTMDMNWERIKTNPSHHSYKGAMLVIRVLFKNLMGQWNESNISYEIPWLTFKNPPPQKTRNLNENTIPPKHILAGDEYRAELCSSRLAPFYYRMITDEHAKSMLQQYIENSPWLIDIIEEIQ